MDIIEVARGCGELYRDADDNDILEFAQRIEQPHLQRIAELELALQKQAKAALLGIDAAKANGFAMFMAAQRQEAQLNPELIESERRANAVLTEENEKLQQQIEQLREALEGVLWDPIHENMEKARKVLRETE